MKKKLNKRVKCQSISTGLQRRSELLPLVSVCFQNDKRKEIAPHTHLTLLGSHTQNQLCKLCQLTIWSEHDHHTQSAHEPDWHRFTEPTLQLPSSSQEYSNKCTHKHITRADAFCKGVVVSKTCREVRVSLAIKYSALQLDQLTTMTHCVNENSYPVLWGWCFSCSKTLKQKLKINPIYLHHHNRLELWGRDLLNNQ